MLTEVTVVPFNVAANTAVPVLFDARLTVMAEALVVGLPKLSSSVVVKAFAAELLAVPVKAVEVMTLSLIHI